MEVTDVQYKESEIGVIPVDWNVKKISDFSKPVRGGSPRPAGSPLYFNGDYIPWLTVAALTNISSSQLFVSETEGFLTQLGSEYSRTLEKDTLIIANSGATLGVAKLLAIKCCANDGIAALNNFSREVDKAYVVYYINSITQKLREVVATGNGQPNLNTTLIGELRIPLPSTKSEQTAIATALSDTDALIENLEKLIAKKRNIKQGVMQELLTGKKRLAGFKGKWVTIKIGEVADIHKGNGLSKTKLKQAGKYGCILYGELFTTYKRIIKNAISHTDYEEGVYSKAGDILMPGSTTTTGIDLAIASAVLKDNILLGGDINVIRPKTASINSIFLAYYITEVLKHKILELTQGITIIHLYGKDLKTLEIAIPEISEQDAIGKILVDIDEELSGLENQMNKYQLIKQGMMQKLLTGKIRLV
ncbi:MAG: restriction endonuclease subunit S [Bacteroidota bacterium]|jgi:type I restriction enzyme S subunit|nr:restriction endonuclease subunit S [Bacteroidota bacterium]